MVSEFAFRCCAGIDGHNLALGSRDVGLPGSRRRSRHGQQLHPTGYGHTRLRSFGASGRRRADRGDAKKQADLDLSAPPITAHAGHDHRATRPEFLHVSCVTLPHGILTGKKPRIDLTRLFLVTRIDAKALEWTPGRGLPARLVGCRLRGLRGSRGLRGGLCFGSRREQNTRQTRQYCRCADPHLDAHSSLLRAIRSPIAAATSTAATAGFFSKNRFPLFRTML